MAPSEWNQVVELFHAALEKSGDQRVLLLDQACGTQTLLRKAVEELLKEHESAGSFLSEPLVDPQARASYPDALVPNRRFERFILLEMLGRGGMGEVWSARDTELDRAVALKFLRAGTPSELDTAHIAREAKAASALNHPNIVTIHEVVRAEGCSAIVMELVQGSSLAKLRGTSLPVAEVLSIGAQVAKALAAAHASGIIHGDIKPENIMLRDDGYVKVLDFGLARRVAMETIAGAHRPIFGTLRYMSPEQATGESLTPASDVFSFGLVLFELATGRHAFADESSLDALQAMLTQGPPAPVSVNPRVPAALNSLLLAMLAKDPGKRPSAEDVVRALSEIQHLLDRPVAGKARRGEQLAAGLLLLSAVCALWFWGHHRAATHEPVLEQVTTLVPENRATAAAISPDGKLAAYANVDGMFVRTIQTGETKTLSSPGDYILDRLAWFADGKRVVASGFSTLSNVPSIWLMSGDGTAPRLLHERARYATPSPDGTHVAFISQDRSEIWVIGVNGESPRRVLTGGPEDAFVFVLWSPDGRRLAFQRHNVSKDIRITYEMVVLATGRITAKAPAPEISSASELADGRLMYLKWDNKNNSSSHQLWEVKTDLQTGAFKGEPRKIAALRNEDATLLGLTAARDGKRVMALMRSEHNAVFVADFDPSPPRIHNIYRLTLDERTNYPHAWTADNRAVIFESNRNGNFDLFKQYTDRRTAEPIVATPLTEMLPQLSPDGRFVLYATRPLEKEKPWFYKPGTYKLMRVPVDGGMPAELPIGGSLDEFRCALGPGTRCVLRTSVRGEYRAYYDLHPLDGKGRELARTKWSDEVLGDWDVSPDGRYVAIPNHDSHSAQIRVIALQPGPHEPRERQVTLAGLTDLRGLVWAADGRAWFVSVDTAIGNRLLYVFLDGRFTSLGDIQGWAVPSPDGRRVAFLDRIIATNAWMIERR